MFQEGIWDAPGRVYQGRTINEEVPTIITNNNGRDITIKLDFLPAGKQYKMTSFSDGVNAHIMAMDYLRQESQVSSTTTLPIHMVRNGGWCARIDLGQ